ncbi:MAG TPA: hypothetical protein VHN80_28765, partial [Kineosporiaceae bacterium]|nr:hypothetical protein [Kineosporiaceae bacterium]
LGVGVTASAVPADRRRLGWLGWGLLTASSWYRLSGASVGLLEAYTVPPALALIGVSAVRLRRDRSGRAWSTLVPGLSLGLLPSVIDAAQGTALRPTFLIGLGALMVLLARSAGRRLEAALWAAGVVTAGSTGALRSVRAAAVIDRPGWLQVEVWSVCAAFVLIAAAVLLMSRHREQAQRLQGWIAVPPLALAVVPTLLAASAAELSSGAAAADDVVRAAALRSGAALAVAGVVAVTGGWLPRPGGGHLELVATTPMRRTATGLALGAGLLGWLTDVSVTELWSVPVAAVLLALGGRRLVGSPEVGSWRALGAGLLVLLVPPLMLSISGDEVWRTVGVALVAGSVLVIGAIRRLQAPTVIGAVTLMAHTAFQLGPWVIRTVEGQPRWVVLGLVGAVLLALGASYERRLTELRAVRLRLVALR